MADEDKAAEILRAAKAERTAPSRALWIAAGVIGLVCTIGFIVLLVTDSSSPSGEPRRTERGELGFGFGLLFGAISGVGVGYALARQRQSSRNTP